MWVHQKPQIYEKIPTTQTSSNCSCLFTFSFSLNHNHFLNKYKYWQLTDDNLREKIKMAISLRLNLSFLIFYLSNIIFIPNLCQCKICLPEERTALFVFGDSLFDPGNNNYINSTSYFQANFSPYGETFFKYPTGRFSDGRLIPHFIGKNWSDFISFSQLHVIKLQFVVVVLCLILLLY